MAQLLSDIKTEIGNAYIGQTIVQTVYGLSASDVALGFDALFSTYTVESLLFYAVAFAVWTFESILDSFQTEMQTTVDAAYIANKDWWHAAAMAFQKGYDLVMNTTTFVYSYATIDTTAQIIQRVAVRENTDQSTGVCKVQLYVATADSSGNIIPLVASDQALFNVYANRIKPAGVLVDIVSGAGDVINFGITVNYNPLILDSTGLSILNGNYPVNDAVTAFISTLNTNYFGGELNLTKLEDAIQAVSGVVDIEITSFSINGTNQPTWGTFDSTNGWFVLGAITPTYQPQTV
jgi:hypothetical protein